MASNSKVYADETGAFEDWIEIYNSTDEEIDIAGVYVSDDPSDLTKYRLPTNETELIVPAKGFILLWASGHPERGKFHLDFSLSAQGESLLLVLPDGITIIDSITFSTIPTDISYGRSVDNFENWLYYEVPTPLNSNTTESFEGVLKPPEFSHAPGFYNERFNLDVIYEDPDVLITFTLDGSEPNLSSSVWQSEIWINDRTQSPNVLANIPTNMIPSFIELGFTPPTGWIQKGNVVRVKAFKTGMLPAEHAATFFVFPEGEETFSLPVFSIMTDSLTFFGNDEGIYVPGVYYEDGDDGTGNYFQRGIDWERSIHLEFFDENELVISQNAGVRIHGGWSRRFPQKSLRLYARNSYSSSNFNYSLFGDDKYNSYKRFILRNSGNDMNLSFIRDGTAQALIRHLNMEDLAYRPSVVFLNGEYWGIHNIRERQDKHYLERKFGVHEDEIDLLSNNMEVIEGDDLHYKQLLQFLEDNDLSDDNKFAWVKTRIDVDNYLNYYSLQVYCANNDWPHNNTDYWRRKIAYDPSQSPGMDGRWRWIVYDLDRSFGYFSNVNTNMLPWITSPSGNGRGAWSTFLFRQLLTNESFKINFINRIADHLNTCFKPDRVNDMITKHSNGILDEIERHIFRWNSPGNLSIWQSEIYTMIHFAKNRPERIREHLMQYFEIDETLTSTLNVNNSNAGFITINSIDINDNTPGVELDTYPWEGVYFKGIPIRFVANPAPGYTFSHWQLNTETLYKDTIIITPENNFSITAHFEIDEQYEFFPAPYFPQSCPYVLQFWDEIEAHGHFPDHMAFVYMKESDPGLHSTIDSFTYGVYHLESRTRINGQNENGVSFINTGNELGNRGYPGTKLGGALLALNTLETDTLTLFWTGRTIISNSRKYSIRLQYRIGDEGEFQNLLDESGQIIEYSGNSESGHMQKFGPIDLPKDLMRKNYVQLFWRYYYTGHGSGPRDQLAIDDILIFNGRYSELNDINAFVILPEYEIHPACKGADGHINLITSGGTGSYQYDWEHDTFLNDAKANELEKGIYSVTIQDENSCKAEVEIQLSGSSPIIYDWQAIPSCSGYPSGQFQIFIENASHPVSLFLDNILIEQTDSIITQWNFNMGILSDSPSPSYGFGEAILIGGTVNNTSDSSGNGSSDPETENNLAWQTTSYPAQYTLPGTAGVQFNLNTTGYQNIRFSFDQRLSNTTANTWVVQYCTDVQADNVEWVDAQVFHIFSQHTGTGDTWYNERYIDLSGIEALNNNPHVGFRIVSDFDPEANKYEPAKWTSEYTGGTSRFDMVTISGDPIMRSLQIVDIESGDYEFTFVDKNDCRTSIFHTIDQLPDILFDIEGPDTVDQNSVSIYHISNDIAATQIDWLIEGGEILYNSNDSIEVLWLNSENGQIEAIVVDTNNCLNKTLIEVQIIEDSTTAIEVKTEPYWHLFPNPSQDKIYITSQRHEEYQLTVFNSVGKLVWTGIMKGIQNSLDIKQWAPGIYFFRMENKNNLVNSGRFIKQ